MLAFGFSSDLRQYGQGQEDPSIGKSVLLILESLVSLRKKFFAPVPSWLIDQGNRILFLGKTEKNTFEDVRGH